jgi:hypothetical protein
MVAVVLTAVVSVTVTHWLVVRHRNGRGSSLFVLAVAPAALLLLAVSAWAGTSEIVQSFGNLSRNGPGDTEAILVQVCRGFLSGLRLAAAGTLVVLAGAAVLQLMARAPAESGDLSPVPPRVGLYGWLLVALPLLVLPTGLLVHLTSDLPRYLVENALAPMRSIETSRYRTGADIKAFSQVLSARLVAGIAGGIAVCAVLSGATIASLLAPKSPRLPPWLHSYAWVAFAVMTAVLIWLMLDLSAEIRFLDTWASEAPNRPRPPD